MFSGRKISNHLLCLDLNRGKLHRRVPSDVDLVAVPSDWDRYVYSGDRVMLSIRAPAPWCRKSTDSRSIRESVNANQAASAQ
jgi:hypothetical protein